MVHPYTDRRSDGCLFETTPIAAPRLLAARSTPPSHIDLRPWCSPVEDQGHVGSCAANAVIGALEYHQRRHKVAEVDLSRLFVYYNARQLARREGEDCGTFIHHAMAAVMAHGACPESLWPYQPAMWASRPTDACYEAATRFGAVSFARAPLGLECRAALAQGLPVVFGARFPNAMLQVEAAATGRINLPLGGWPAPGGGHAMLVVGYDDGSRTWTVRNSWGAAWGDRGHVHIPFEVMERYAMPTQFWVIGALDTAALEGPAPREALAKIAAEAPQQASTALDELRSGLRTQLEDNLNRAREGFRNRLRE